MKKNKIAPCWLGLHPRGSGSGGQCEDGELDTARHVTASLSSSPLHFSSSLKLTFFYPFALTHSSELVIDGCFQAGTFFKPQSSDSAKQIHAACHLLRSTSLQRQIHFELGNCSSGPVASCLMDGRCLLELTAGVSDTLITLCW